MWARGLDSGNGVTLGGLGALLRPGGKLGGGNPRLLRPLPLRPQQSSCPITASSQQLTPSTKSIVV